MGRSTAYDYVIVGAGTAGSLLAARLTEDETCRVLLLEAGPKDRNFWTKLPVGYFKSIYNPNVTHLYRAEADEGIAGRRMDCPRGRILGGSGAINGLIYARGQHEDFDDWEHAGAMGWSYRDILPFFRSVEKYDGQPSQHRGAHGALAISRLRNKNAACDAWLRAAQSYGLPYNEDMNGDTTYGVGAYQLTLDGHWRTSTARAFLKPSLGRSNLELKTGATVLSLTHEKGQITGLSYEQGGQIHQVQADQEVILCAGAVQTPQILQLSGIGPERLLTSLGIDVVYPAEEVGQNLQDHLQMRTIVEMSQKGYSLNDHLRNPLRLAEMAFKWVFQQSGPLTVGAGQVGGAACTKYAKHGRPDLQLFVMPLSVDKPGTPLHRYSGFTTSLWQCHPESRGFIEICDKNPKTDPRIVLNYLSSELDQKVMVEGVKMVRDIYHQKEFRSWWKREIIPGDDIRTEADILDAVRRISSTVYHLVGTCRMGSDAKAVVDPTLCVNGVRGLRVVDASVMPSITSANTNAPTIMIAEKAAHMIRSTFH